VLFLCLSNGRSLFLIVACVSLFPGFVRGSALLDWRVYIFMWSSMLSANLQSHSCTTTENMSDGKDRRRRREELSKAAGSDGAMLYPMGSWVLRHLGAQIGSAVFLSDHLRRPWVSPAVSCLPDQDFSISLVSHVATKKCEQCKTHLDARR
jgi:hypothetical protein